MMWFKANWFIVLLWASLIFQLVRIYVSGRFGRFLDSANHRSLHRGEILTGGGFVLFTPVVVYLAFHELYLPAVMLVTLILLGLVDDIRYLSARFRFLVQLVVAIVTLWYLGFGFSLWWLFLCLALLWWLNLFNFMDGANGLVALHAMVTLVALLLLHGFSKDHQLLIVLVVISLFVYLYFNVFLKVLFMGDSGSLPLAFLIAFISLLALKAGSLTALQIAVMHAVLITDSTLTLAMRCVRRERLAEAHRSHLYQRLIGLDTAHWRISVLYTTVTLGCCVIVFMMADRTLSIQFAWFMSVYAILAAVFFHSRSIGR